MRDSNIQISFAPLQGYTEALYRNAHQEFFGGVDCYYTPFVRLEKNEFRHKDMRDILPDNNKVQHLIPQMIASTPDELNRIADKFVESGYTKADLNLGCPFPLIANRHKGSGLLPFPTKVAAMLDAINQRDDLKFSVKTRLGWDNPQECLDLLPVINQTRLTNVTMHPRIGKQQYKGDVDLDTFSVFYEGCTQPLFYNGNLSTIEDIEMIVTRFPRLSGIMLGRGLLANPALALEWKTGISLDEKDLKKRIKMLHEEMLEFYREHLHGEHQMLGKLQPIWEYLLPTGDKKLRKKIRNTTKLNNYVAYVNELLNS